MMAVMPQEDSEEHLDEPDIIDDFLNSLADQGNQDPSDQDSSDPGPSGPGFVRSPWTVTASMDAYDPEPLLKTSLCPR